TYAVAILSSVCTRYHVCLPALHVWRIVPHCPRVFFLQWSLDHRDLHSFPTRRSSDLRAQGTRGADRAAPADSARDREGPDRLRRSEEHTSELQSRVDLVCRLLLEKKKTSLITRYAVNLQKRLDSCIALHRLLEVL